MTTNGFYPRDGAVEFSSDGAAIKECIEAAGIPFLDPRSAYPHEETDPWYNQSSIGHLSPLGNSLMADSLASALIDAGALGHAETGSAETVHGPSVSR